MRKGGGGVVSSVRCMCDVCAAHGNRAAVGVGVDAQGSGFREDDTCLLFIPEYNAAFVSKRILVGLRWHAEEAVVFLGFPMYLSTASPEAPFRTLHSENGVQNSRVRAYRGSAAGQAVTDRVKKEH